MTWWNDNVEVMVIVITHADYNDKTDCDYGDSDYDGDE